MKIFQWFGYVKSMDINRITTTFELLMKSEDPKLHSGQYGFFEHNTEY
jgi:hypothetical protein